MPLLAATEVPAWLPMFAIVAIAIALVGTFGVILLLRGLRELRTGFAEEIKRELAARSEVSRIDVQSPLVVKQHEPCASLTQHQDLQEKFGELVEQRRKDVYGLHLKIEGGLAAVRTDMTEEFKEVRETQVKSREEIAAIKEQNANQTRELLHIRNTVENMPEKIAKLIKP